MSILAGSWVALHNAGDAPAEALMVCPNSDRKHPEFAADVKAQAAEHGVELDASGYLCPAGVTPSSVALRAMGV